MHLLDKEMGEKPFKGEARWATHRYRAGGQVEQSACPRGQQAVQAALKAVASCPKQKSQPGRLQRLGTVIMRYGPLWANVIRPLWADTKKLMTIPVQHCFPTLQRVPMQNLYQELLGETLEPTEEFKP